MHKPVSLWPGVSAKIAKKRVYWYWTRSKPWVRLPDPYSDPDAFMRKVAHLGRVAGAAAERNRSGTFGAMASLYRTMPAFTDRKPNTRRSYSRYLERLLRAYGDAPIREITREDFQTRVMDANADTPGAANHMLHVARAVFKFAGKRVAGLIDPTGEIEPYGNKTEREPWPAHVLEAALASDDDEFRRAVALHYFTGQRTGDACAMAWGSVRGDAIEVRQEKTGEPLTIALHPYLTRELQTAPRRAIVILTNKRGLALKPDAFRKWCHAFSKPFGLKLTAHGLRKNAVNALFEAGCTAVEVMAVSGHRSLSMVEHYGKRRNQPRLNSVATAKWAASTKREREN